MGYLGSTAKRRRPSMRSMTSPLLPIKATLGRRGLSDGLTAAAVLAAVLGVIPAHAGSAAEHVIGPTCAKWDEVASEAIVHLVREKEDAALRQVGDAIFRMRRARRSCQMG